MNALRMQDGENCEGKRACIGASPPLIHTSGQCYSVTVRYLHRANGATFKLWYQLGEMRGSSARFDHKAPWHTATVRCLISARAPRTALALSQVLKHARLAGWTLLLRAHNLPQLLCCLTSRTASRRLSARHTQGALSLCVTHTCMLLRRQTLAMASSPSSTQTQAS